MPSIEGRKYERPACEPIFKGAKLVLMFHDKGHSLNWVRVEYSPEEFGELFDLYADWLYSSGQADALARLMEKR